MNKRFAFVAMLALLAVAGVLAADLSISTQVNLAAPDYANNFFTFKGSIGAADKDQFVPDATSGASKLKSTSVFNPYRTDVKGKKTLPAGLRGLFLYGVADFATRQADSPKAVANNGVITVTYVHRGTAYEIVTDAAGKLVLPNGAFRLRVIGATDNTIAADFSATGKVADIDWAKVWDSSIPAGKQIGTTTSKTGAITADVANSDLYAMTGTLQVSLADNILKISGELDAVKR